jgi:hypothetical protein
MAVAIDRRDEAVSMSGRRWMALAFVALAQLMVALDAATVKTHLLHVYGKLGVRDHAAAAGVASVYARFVAGVRDRTAGAPRRWRTRSDAALRWRCALEEAP